MKLLVDKDASLNLAKAYNLGMGQNVTILELAELVKRCGKEILDKDVVIEVEPADIKMEIGMDNTMFCQTFNWHPKRTYKDMIVSLYALNNNELVGRGKWMPYSFTVVYA